MKLRFINFTIMLRNKPIGIFDSGVGGSSIWQELHQLLPYEHTIYLADSKNAPYGQKSPDEIIDLSVKNTKVLLDKGCKIIVVACNTATTNAISVLRKTFDTPIIGIEPAVKPAALMTTTKSIGILATRGTLSSILFHKTSEEFANGISVLEIVGEGLVSLIESNKIHSDEMTQLLEKYTKPMIEANIDYLVLGCTHYPYLIDQLKKILPPQVQILDSGLAVAKHTENTLTRLNLLRTETSKPTLQFYTNASPAALTSLLKNYSEEISISEIKF